MGALLGVARGSQEPPKFIILEYNGAKKKDERPVVLVGKTITFDTGGISLKPAENMEHMKADMTGGAEVLASIRAAARLKLPLRLISILPVAENMPGGRAMKPGDIVNDAVGEDCRSAEHGCGRPAHPGRRPRLCDALISRRP